MNDSELVVQLLTLDVLEKLILRNVNLFECLVYLLLPQGYNLIKGQYVARRSHIEDLIQGSWIIHSFYGIIGNIFLMDKIRLRKIELVRDSLIIEWHSFLYKEQLKKTIWSINKSTNMCQYIYLLDFDLLDWLLCL